MKLTLLRPAMLLALALCVAGCGSKNMFDINVNFVDDQGNPALPLYTGLVLTNGSDTLAVAPGTKTTKFSRQIEYGTVYTVATPPETQQPLHQNCTVFGGGSDTAGRLATINVYVNCTVDVHNVIASVTGLTGTQSVVLANGRTGLTVTAAAVAIPVSPNAPVLATFPVTYNDAYGITVVTQPAGSTCVVENGVGVMGDLDKTDVKVVCTKI